MFQKYEKRQKDRANEFGHFEATRKKTLKSSGTLIYRMDKMWSLCSWFWKVTRFRLHTKMVENHKILKKYYGVFVLYRRRLIQFVCVEKLDGITAHSQSSNGAFLYFKTETF